MTLPLMRRGVLLLPFLFGVPPALAEPPRRPPIILISLCSVRADHLGCYGYRRPTTPALDAFTKDALLFETAVSASSWTSPAVMSVFTSLLPRKHGVESIYGPPVEEAAAEAPLPADLPTPVPLDPGNLPSSRLRAGVATMAEVLRDNGYATCGFGMNRAALNAEMGFSRGFDEYTLSMKWPEVLGLAETALSTTTATGKPVFLFVQNRTAHFDGRRSDPPYDAPDESYRALGLRPLRPRPTKVTYMRFDNLRENPPWPPRVFITRLQNSYDAGLRTADGEIGQFLDALKKNGLYEDSLIVVFTDHGDETLDHGRIGHLGYHFENRLRMAMMIKLPGNRLGGRRRGFQVRGIDILPTILDLAGVTPSPALRAQMEGISLTPYFEGGDPGLDACSQTQSFIHPWIFSVRTHDGWKLIADVVNGDRSLYDLNNDPSESEDLIGKNPPELGRLEQGLLDCRGY